MRVCGPPIRYTAPSGAGFAVSCPPSFDMPHAGAIGAGRGAAIQDRLAIVKVIQISGRPETLPEFDGNTAAMDNASATLRLRQSDIRIS
ncbi:hypothetical protein Ate01nite_30830 [Actinoplanes teichomyceticus]|nr:hypothetical protein Ate01nite_30830 [Actinoplanes teichomyceticus]